MDCRSPIRNCRCSHTTARHSPSQNPSKSNLETPEHWIFTPITIGEVFGKPVTGERSVILERPWDNPEGRLLTAEMTALVGSRVAGEHYHPALVERFTVLEGELTVKCGGQTSMLRQGESAVIQAGVWHDWWNAADRNARVRVEVTPGERLGHLLETFFGLARLGHTDSKGMPPRVAARAHWAGVQRRDRVPFAAAGGPALRSLARWLRSHVGAAIVRRTRSSPAPCSRLGPST